MTHHSAIPFGALLLCAGLTACSSSSTAATDAAPRGDTATPGDAAPETAPEALPADTGSEIPATDISCNQIRICASSCTTAACVNTCENRGTMAAKTLFQAYSACVNPQCSDPGDLTCQCEASCFATSICSNETEACTGQETDFVCDELCH
jgi:hypothetical protein